MTNPVVTATPEGVWTKVATNVTSGRIHILKTDTLYSQTYRDTADPAPTLIAEGARVVGPILEISSTVGIDVYIWCVGVAGQVRVDL